MGAKASFAGVEYGGAGVAYLRWAVGALAALGLGGTALAQPQPAPQPSPPPLEAYGRLPTVTSLSLSPSGERLASVGDVNGKRVVLVRTLTGTVLFASPVGNEMVRSSDWVDDDHVLVTVSGTGSFDQIDISEFFFTLSLNLRTQKATWLFAGNPKFLAFHLGIDRTLVLNGHPYVYIRNVPREGQVGGSRIADRNSGYWTRGYPDLFRIDLDTNVIDVAAKGTDTVHEWTIAPDGSVAAFANMDLSTNNFTVYRGEDPIFSRKSPRLTLGLAGLGRRPDTVLVEDDAAEGAQLLEVEPGGGYRILFPGQNITARYHNPTTGLLIGVSLDHQIPTLFDKGLQAKLDAATKPFAGRTILFNSWTEDLGRIVFRTEGAGDSGTYWLVDLKAHAASVIDNDYPGVPPEQTAPVRMYHYKASDGLALDGVLTLPPGAERRKRPVVVLPHGGPIGVHDRDGFDWMAQALASRGYVVFQPNYRGSGGHGPAFEQAGYGEFGRRMLSDMSDGLAALAADGLVDAKRACIVGFSYGGYAAMAGITVQQGLYRCAVAGSGVADLPMFLDWEEERSGWKSEAVRFWREALGVGKAGAAPVASISPSRLAARADAPLLLIHGRNDTVVPLIQSEQMERAMKAAGKSVQLIVTEGEDHWLSKSETRLATLKAAVAFVQQHNPAD